MTLRQGFALTWLLAVLLPTTIGCDDSPPAQQGKVLRLAVTTTTRDSGLLDKLVPVFERQHPIRVDVIAVGTGKALRLGEAGDVDVVWVHSRKEEEVFMSAEHGVRHEEVMYNSFIIVGPESDPASIKGSSAALAMQKIAIGKHRFVSRGDDSGTHKCEVALWDRGGGLGKWDVYLETRNDMGATLHTADQIRAYCLTDRGTYLRFRSEMDLVALVEDSPELDNLYGILVVNPNKHQAVRKELANTFVDFLLSNQAQQIIRDYRIEGEPLFFPLHLAAGE